MKNNSCITDTIICVPASTTIICVYENCHNEGRFQCSRCKKSFYCCQQHQKHHWKIHKIDCKNSITIANSNSCRRKLSNDRIDRYAGEGSLFDENKKYDDYKSNNTDNIDDKKNDNNDNDCDNKRICRCMFCGEELLLGSEDEAIKHMSICNALQEQLSSNHQFTIPTTIHNKLISSSSSSSIASSSAAAVTAVTAAVTGVSSSSTTPASSNWGSSSSSNYISD